MSDRERKRRLFLRQRGTPCLVSATDARVRAIRARVRSYHDRGMSYAQMGRQLGLSYRTVQDAAVNVGAPMLRRTLNAVSLLRFEEPHPDAQVSGTGTRRRLLAMQYDGFPLSWLAEQTAGTDRRHLQRLASGEKGGRYIMYGTAREIRDLYDKLADSTPEELGVGLHPQARHRYHARRLGGVPRSCWDPGTIDDPEAIPQWTGRCGTALGRYIHEREDIPLCPPCKAAGRIKQPVTLVPGVLAGRRAQLGWTLKELHERTGKEARTIYAWERGVNHPRLKPLEEVLVHYDLLLEDVLDQKEEG